MWFLEIDNREHGMNFDSHENISIIKKTLQVGDIQIRKDDEIIAIFERKTISDLLCSLKDGRYSEQKSRLLSSRSIHKGYILEGSFENEPIVWQIILRLQCKDRLICFTTKNLNETQDIVSQLFNKFQKDQKMYMQNVSPHLNYTDCLHVAKKSNLNPERCFIIQLKQIPGISTKTAEAIAELYTSWMELLAVFTEKSVVEIKKSFDASKRIGIKKLQKIKEYSLRIDT